MSAARNTSIASIVERRSQRCTAFAANGPPIAAGSNRRVRIPPTAAGESVSLSVSAMNANVPIQSPSADTPWPRSSVRNPPRRNSVRALITHRERSRSGRWLVARVEQQPFGVRTPPRRRRPSVGGDALDEQRDSHARADQRTPSAVDRCEEGRQQQLRDETTERALPERLAGAQAAEQEEAAGPAVDRKRTKRGCDPPASRPAQKR